MTDLFKPTFIRAGTPINRARPPTSVRAPTSPGQATLTECEAVSSGGVPAVPYLPVPSSVRAGNLILGVIRTDTASPPAAASGWTLEGEVLGAGNDNLQVFSRVADGSEAGNQEMTASSMNFASVCWLVTNPGSTTVTLSAFGDGTTQVPPVTPSQGAGTYFVFEVCGYKNSNNPNVTPSTGYTEMCGAQQTAANDFQILSAYRLVDIATVEDPDAMGSGPSGSGPQCVAIAVVHESDPTVASFDHSHVEADITDLAHTTTLDHGVLTGRDDDDHTLYTKADGTRAFTGTVSGVTPTASTHLATKGYVDSVGGGGGGGGTVPQWMEYLAARQSGETAHTDDDFFDDDDHTAWTKLNVTGNHTLTEKYGVLSVAFDSQSGSDLNAALKALTPSSAPITIETAMRVQGKSENFTIAGLVFADGTTSTSNIAAATFNNWSLDYVRNGTFTAAGAPAGGTLVVQSFQPYSHMYVRLIWKSSNTFAVAISPDGVSWMDGAIADQSVTLTPTHFGMVWSRWGGGAEPSVVAYDYIRVYESDLSV